MEIERRAEFARRMGVTPAAVTKWAAAGRLVLADDGRVEVAGSMAKLADTLNTRGGKRQAGVSGGAQASVVPSGEFDFSAGTLTEAKTIQARVRSRLDQVELDEHTGRLVERTRVELAIADGLTAILSQLDTLSARIAPKVAAETEVRRIQDLIDDEVARLRQDTADTLRQMISGGVRQ